uniref:Transcriptional regulator ATRX n=3 Tax=Parascaris univalens TaxID=6257 RepID=A0A915AWD2_PARUN
MDDDECINEEIVGRSPERDSSSLILTPVIASLSALLQSIEEGFDSFRKLGEELTATKSRKDANEKFEKFCGLIEGHRLKIDIHAELVGNAFADALELDEGTVKSKGCAVGDGSVNGGGAAEVMERVEPTEVPSNEGPDDNHQLQYMGFFQSEDTLGSLCPEENQQTSKGESALRELESGYEIEQRKSDIWNSSFGVKAEELMEVSGDSMKDVVDHRCNDEESRSTPSAVARLGETPINRSRSGSGCSSGKRPPTERCVNGVELKFPNNLTPEDLEATARFGCVPSALIHLPLKKTVRSTMEDLENGFKEDENESSSEGSVISETDLRLQEEVRRERARARLRKRDGVITSKQTDVREKRIMEESTDGGKRSSNERDSDGELNTLLRKCKHDGGDGDKLSREVDEENSKNPEGKKPTGSKEKGRSTADYGPEYMYITDEEQKDGDGIEVKPTEGEKNRLVSSKEEETNEVGGKRGGGGRGISTDEPKRRPKKLKEVVVTEGDEDNGDGSVSEQKGEESNDEVEEVVEKKQSKVDKLISRKLDLSDSGGDDESGNQKAHKSMRENGRSKKKKTRKVICSSESDVSDEESWSVESFGVIEVDSDSSAIVYSDDEEVSTTSRSKAGSKPQTRKRRKNSNATQSKKRRVRIDDSEGSGKSDEESTNEHKKKKRRTKPILIKEDSEESEESGEESTNEHKKKRGRAKPILTKDKLAKETVDAEKAEKERRKRIEAKQKEFNGIEFAEGTDLASTLNNSQRLKSIVLDPDSKSEEPCPVAVHQSLVRYLKKHQAEGIQFLYNCTIESLDRLDEEGGGAILAHCMGLGKTLQVIAFLHTIMMHSKIGEKVRHVLVVVPKNVVLNWYNEFEKWLDNDDIDRDLATINVMELDSLKEYSDRHMALQNWYQNEEPSVMIIGYDMFRILTRDDDDNIKSKKMEAKKKLSKQARKLAKLQPDFRKFLQDPGPDLIVCDEAHKLKNDESALTKTMVKIRTRRRICLTGTPLQNSLMEYHCMVNFVKQGLMGTKGEFANRFANIINRGRVKDATPAEVRFMKRRCHVLCEHLKGVVQRVDYRVLLEAIPPKQEYVINVRLTPRQVSLYRAFLERVGNDRSGLSKRLLPDYHILSRIWTHPHQLIAHEVIMEKKRLFEEEKEEIEDFIDDGEETPSVVETSDDDVVVLDGEEGCSNASAVKSNGGLSAKTCRKSKRLAGEEAEEIVDGPRTPPEFRGWYAETGLVTEADENDFSLSNKLMLLVQIVKKCEEIGDKILVFSQSIESLTLIKRMLHYMDSHDLWFSDGHEAIKSANERWGWIEGRDYMVIDGQVQSGKRQEVQTKFNNPNNLRARLMLISTRAGSLGTNMVAANRVIIFDACWNPSHDTQSLFRVYRFGQTKPVYIYRFIAQGTMEERIYKRQVTKESTALRVIDEAQIQRHFDGHDLMELYSFEPDELNETDGSASKRPPMAPPKDRLLRDIIFTHKDAIVNYLHHDSLFEDLEEEKLTEEECQEAWQDYEREKSMVVSGRNAYLPYEHQLLAEHNQIEVERRLAGGTSLPHLQTDPVYSHSFSIQGMDVDTAIKLAYLKVTLDNLLRYIPPDLRGTMENFTLFFFNLINNAVRNRDTPQDTLAKAVGTFRMVTDLTRNLPDCVPVLRYLYRTSSQFFDPMQPPP